MVHYGLCLGALQFRLQCVLLHGWGDCGPPRGCLSGEELVLTPLHELRPALLWLSSFLFLHLCNLMSFSSVWERRRSYFLFSRSDIKGGLKTQHMTSELDWERTGSYCTYQPKASSRAALSKTVSPGLLRFGIKLYHGYTGLRGKECKCSRCREEAYTKAKSKTAQKG